MTHAAAWYDNENKVGMALCVGKISIAFSKPAFHVVYSMKIPLLRNTIIANIFIYDVPCLHLLLGCSSLNLAAFCPLICCCRVGIASFNQDHSESVRTCKTRAEAAAVREHSPWRRAFTMMVDTIGQAKVKRSTLLLSNLSS